MPPEVLELIRDEVGVESRKGCFEERCGGEEIETHFKDYYGNLQAYLIPIAAVTNYH